MAYLTHAGNLTLKKLIWNYHEFNAERQTPNSFLYVLSMTIVS